MKGNIEISFDLSTDCAYRSFQYLSIYFNVLKL